jgi:hypothetical protein
MNQHFRPPRAIPPTLMRPASGRLVRTDEGALAIGDVLAPETPMRVEIVGLSEEAQRAILDRFAGGSRFRLG